MNMTLLKVMHHGTQVSIYVETDLEQIKQWAATLSPDNLLREALKTGSVFKRAQDFDYVAEVFYPTTQPSAVRRIRFWNADGEVTQVEVRRIT